MEYQDEVERMQARRRQQGQAQGKTEEMISSLENSGIELSSNKALTRYL